MEVELIRQMVKAWREEFAEIKEQLFVRGDRANSIEYNILATEALRLSLCINDATDLLLTISENKQLVESD